MSQSPDRCPGLKRVDELEWLDHWDSPSIGVRGKPLSPKGAHIGIAVMELPPGCNTGTAHYHMKEEEHLYVLEGSMEVRLGKEWYGVAAGDYLCFPAGDPREHKFRNPSEVPCRYIFLGERFPDDVIVYPDTEAVRVRSLRKVVRLSDHPCPEIDD